MQQFQTDLIKTTGNKNEKIVKRYITFKYVHSGGTDETGVRL